MIIGKGSALLSKKTSLQAEDGTHSKNVEIVYIPEGSVVGCELFMINSKPIHSLITPHVNNGTKIA